MHNYRGEVKVPEDKNAPRRFIVASIIINTTDPIAFDKAISDLVEYSNELEHKVSAICHHETICEVFDK